MIFFIRAGRLISIPEATTIGTFSIMGLHSTNLVECALLS